MEQHVSVVSRSSLSRRALLAVFASGSTAATAGCGALSSDGGSDSDPRAGSPAADSETPTATDNETAAGTQALDPALAVRTRAPTTVGSTSGRLRGTLAEFARYETADCYFQLRHVGERWRTTPRQSRSSPGEFSQRLSGLSPETEYEFRAVAEAGDRTLTGRRHSFTTRENPNTVTLATDQFRLFFDEAAGGPEAVAEIPVENVGGRAGGRIELAVTWYDDERTELGTTTDRLHTLLPGETWLAQVTARGIDAGSVTSFTASKTVERSPPRGPESVRVGHSELRTDGYPTEIRGVVENTGEETATDVEPIGRVFDDQGRLVADSRTYAPAVAPGGDQPFVASFFRRSARRIRPDFDHEVVLTGGDRG